MLNTQFLDQLTRFNLVINKRVTSNLSGPRKSMAGGHGMTFKDSSSIEEKEGYIFTEITGGGKTLEFRIFDS